VDTDRLTFLLGPEALEEIEGYDLENESDRIEIVERYLPLPADAPTRQARMAVRTVAFNQILDDDPPETWRTVERLRGAGLDREAVLSQLAMVISETLSSALESRSTFDSAGYVAALDELPLPTFSAIARASIDTVRAQPGRRADELEDRLLAALSPSRSQIVASLIEHVLDDLIDGPLHLLPGDATVYVPDLIDERTLTHRLTEAEAELGILTVAFDLGAYSRFDTVLLADGAELDQHSVERDHLAWRGPQGWLAAFQPGDLLAVTVTVVARDGGVDEPVDATVSIEALSPEPELSDEAVRAVKAGYDELLADLSTPVAGDELWFWLCFHRSGLFAVPRPPLDELCEAAGLERRGGRVAHDEAIWREDLFARRYDQVMALVRDPRWRFVVGRALEVLDDPDVSVDEVRNVLDECAEPETLDTLADVLFPHHLDLDDEFELGSSDAPGRLFELVGRATAVARRPRETATAEYLACVLYERCGAPERAEEHLARAVRATPHLGPVVERMGWYRFDRGDARGAMRWWRQLDELPPAADTIEPFLSTAGRRELGRNEPCWCGSGRKFKQCHQGSTELPALPDRVGWLCRKAAVWLEHTAGQVRDDVLHLAAARATADPDADLFHLDADPDDLAEMFSAAFADPIVFDAALHEGGLFALFLHERGALLPDDEQLLVASWQTVDRSVHEVVALEPGASITLRNLANGDVVEVRERTASRTAEVGERYCARVVSDGAGHQVIGGIFPVRAGHESVVVDLCANGDGAELCAWVGALHQPPQLVHTPGLADSMFDRDAVDAVLADLDDDADEETVMARLNAELARQAQTRWLDESVPALGGLTPREAAADPTRREQLERLLDEFDRMDERFRAGSGDLQAISYDVAELRRELGVD
jgi:hypothetical protein